MSFSLDDYKLGVSSREGEKEKERERKKIMKLNDIVQIWNNVSEEMAQAHQL